MSRLLEASPTKRGFRAGATVGRGVNLTLAFIFFVLIILSLAVVGSLATLHDRLSDHPDHSNSSRVCILFSSQENGQFRLGESHACEAEIYGFAVMAGVFVGFLVVSIARVVVAADVWYTAIVEVAVIAVLTVFSFSLGLVITSGLSRTCDTVLDINKEENNCDRKVPSDRDGVKYYHSANSAQASVWMSFFLLLLLTLVYGVRVFIFFHRLKLARRSPDRQPLLMKTGLEESHTNPI